MACWYCARGLHLLCPAANRRWQGTCDCTHSADPTPQEETEHG